MQRRDIPANSRKLTDLEELVVFQHILDLDSKGFPPGYLLKIWQIKFLQHAICHALRRVRLLTLLSAARSSGHASSEHKTARELSAKIQKSFVAGLSLYGTQLESMESTMKISTTLTRLGL